MKSIFSKFGLGLVSLFSVFGLNLTSPSAELPKGVMDIREDSPLYLQHASEIAQQAAGDRTVLADHESHYSHSSHSSHESHYSHYSSRY